MNKFVALFVRFFPTIEARTSPMQTRGREFCADSPASHEGRRQSSRARRHDVSDFVHETLIVQLEDKEVAWFHLHEAGWRRKHKLYQRFNTAENSAPRTNFISLYNTLDAFQSVFWARTRQRITFSISFPSPISLSRSYLEWSEQSVRKRWVKWVNVKCEFIRNPPDEWYVDLGDGNTRKVLKIEQSLSSALGPAWRIAKSWLPLSQKVIKLKFLKCPR